MTGREWGRRRFLGHAAGAAVAGAFDIPLAHPADHSSLQRRSAGKFSGLLSRRPGTTRQAFRDYYETSHARLAMKYFPFSKYVRNHVVEASGDIDFDVVSEFYFAVGTDIGGVQAGPVHSIMDADERRFMDQSLIRSTSVEEIILSGPPRDVAAPGTRRQMLLLDARGAADSVFRVTVEEWGRALASQQRVMRVSMDAVHASGTGDRVFPYQAILSLWLGVAGKAVALPQPPAGVALGVSLLVDVCESPPQLLAELYDPVVR